jgi:hypothetical protein
LLGLKRIGKLTRSGGVDIALVGLLEVTVELSCQCGPSGREGEGWGTDVKLLLLRRLDFAGRREILDDLNGFGELGVVGHGVWLDLYEVGVYRTWKCKTA